MTLWLGMDRDNGQALTDMDHVRQSVRDILLTPQGSRLARRQYGSLLAELIDQPQNPALNLKLMSAVYMAITRFEPRLLLTSVSISNIHESGIIIELTGKHDNGQSLTFEVNTGVKRAGD